MESGARLAVGSYADVAGMPPTILHATVIYTLVGSAIAFQCFNITLNFTPALKKYDTECRYRWRNIITSFAHAVITGLCSSYCLYSSPEILEDLTHNVTSFGEMLVALSVGYFIYDLIDNFSNRPISKTWPLVIHHTVILFCFGITLHLRSYVGYALVGLLAEVNSVFLHLRQILILMNTPKHSSVYRANSAANIATFFVFRFGTLFWMFYWLQTHYQEVPTILSCIATVGLVTMVIINMVLLKRLLISDIIAPGDKLKKHKNILEK